MSSRVSNFLVLCAWYLPVLLVQVVSARWTFSGLEPWYRGLNKAAWNPPDWVFGPVWTILYIMMAVAVYLVYQTRGPHPAKGMGYVLFFAQLAVNGAWTLLFFGMRQPGWALLDLTALVLLVAAMAITFYRVRPLAGLLLIPYLVWVAYAFTLNAAVYWLN